MVRNIALSMVVSVILLSALAGKAGAQVEESEVYSKDVQMAWIQSVVRIQAETPAGIYQGCGVCVAYNPNNGVAVILTAAHLVKDAKHLSFQVFSTRSYPNPVRRYYRPQAKWRWNNEDDIGVIVVRIWVPAVAPLATDATAVSEGDNVLCLGCGIGAPPTALVGKIVGVYDSRYYVVDRGGVGGRSGGPLIGRQGVVGIHSRGGNGRTFFVTLDKIHTFVQRNWGYILGTE